MDEEHITLANQKAKSGDYEEALRLFREAGGAEGAYGEGACLYKLGRVDDARAALKRCLEIDPLHQKADQLLQKVRRRPSVPKPRTDRGTDLGRLVRGAFKYGGAVLGILAFLCVGFLLVVALVNPGKVICLSEFNKIHAGMSYSEVTSIIGSKGALLSENRISTGLGGEIHTAIYAWRNSDGSNMKAIFQEDKLISKAQFGLDGSSLPSGSAPLGEILNDKGLQARVDRANNNMRLLAVALECYYIDNNTYPPAMDSRGNLVCNSQSFSIGYTPWLLTTPTAYVESLPYDPFNPGMYYHLGVNYLQVWIMTSHGPDHDQDMQDQPYVDPKLQGWGQIREYLSQYSGTYVEYDPTNGTYSSGDIFRTGP